MSSKKMFLSLVPWAVFAIVVNRHGAAAVAALVAATMSLGFLARDRRRGGVKIIDVTGVVTFGAFSAVGLVGGPPTDTWIADYGRGSAAAVLAVIMLGSAVTVPFTEQYARETVPREYWPSPVFRSVNRRISALWGGVVAVMAAGHLLASAIDLPSDPVPGARPVDLLLNWALPAALILLAVNCTQRISAAARHENTASQAYAARQPDFPAQQRRGEHRPVPAATSLTSSGDRSEFVSVSNEIAGS
jgi:hypothetical protein